MRDHSREFDHLMQALDLVLAAAVFITWVSAAVGPGVAGSSSSLLPLGLIASLFWPVAIRVLGLYGSQRRQELLDLLRQLATIAIISVLVESAAAFLTRSPVPRWLPIACGLSQFAAIASARIVVYGFLRSLRRTGQNQRNVLIAGSGPRAGYVNEVIQRHPAWGLEVVGFIDDRDGAHRPEIPFDCLFDLSEMNKILRSEVIDEVIVACPRSKLDDFLPIVDQATAAGVPITLLSDIFGDLLPAPRVKRFGTLPALSFAPVHHEPAGLAVKRAVDIVGSSFGLILTAPIIAAAALAIRLTSPGPVLFQQVRCTVNGRLFTMPKLRSMVVDSDVQKTDLHQLNEMDGPVFKIKDDPRITPVGRFLRRYSLDELPQLWSVLRGDMSLVGPRPPVPGEVAEYRTFERRRLSMRPGLTCLWQVSGRNEIGFEDWVRLDLEYIDNWSLSSDFWILARTVPAVLTGHGAS